MIEESVGICRWLLGATGLSAIIIGATAPINDLWPKAVAILGGLVAAIVSVMFTTFIRHIYSHSEIIEKQVDKKLENQVKLCTAGLHEVVRDTIKEVFGNTDKKVKEEIEENN